MDSMSLRDMAFWVCLATFETGMFVTFDQHVKGGIALIVIGMIGMGACAWPHIKGKTVRPKYLWIIGIVTVLVLIASVVSGVSKHQSASSRKTVPDSGSAAPQAPQPLPEPVARGDEPIEPCAANPNIAIRTHDFGIDALGQHSLPGKNWIEVVNKGERPLELKKAYKVPPKRFHVISGDFILTAMGTCYRDFLSPVGYRDSSCRATVVFAPEVLGTQEGRITLMPDGKECSVDLTGTGIPGSLSPYQP